MYSYSRAAIAASIIAVASAQQPGTLTKEVHPALPIQSCTAGGCKTVDTSITLDANWRYLHAKDGGNCFDGSSWNVTNCPDAATCAKNCHLEGADYPKTYGVKASGSDLTLNFITNDTAVNIGSRLYMMASDTEYKMFKLLNQEFSFEVDVSNLPCGLNGALYFVEMDADGGAKEYKNNKAGAAYGTGYCDAQCPQTIKFIDGQANSAGWNSTTQTGTYGTCCNEMDIWEANEMSAAFTAHPCSIKGQVQCSGANCTSVCDTAGCDFNSYRMGNTSFYGPKKTVDTTKPFTVVTQFHTSDNTTTGNLTAITRQYVQNGVVIMNSNVEIPGVAPNTNSITDAFCTAQKKATADPDVYGQLGGTSTIGKALGRGMALVLSVWDDTASNMLWLDSDYPATMKSSAVGVARGSCATTSGVQSDLITSAANASVVFSNIKYGAIGSTVAKTTTSGPAAAVNAIKWKSL